ncbi:MAG: ABC transporter permease [Dehalococcoidales bacterium]
MNKALLIFKHEFRAMLMRKGFIIMTFIVPLIALLGIVGYQIVSRSVTPSEEITRIGYVDGVGGFDQFTTQGKIDLVPFDAPADANKAMGFGDIKGYFVITPDYLTTSFVNYYTLEKQLELPPDTVSAVKSFLTSNLLTGKVPPATIDLVKAPLGMASIRLTETGDVSTEQGGYGNFMIPAIFSILLDLSIIFSSSYLIQGMGDEKENRLIEVLLSSVSARQLIIGKVLGLGAAGLLQVVVWMISTPLILGLASSSIGGFLSTLSIPPSLFVLFIIYFILGYLLFAMISTAIGAISPSAREGQQIATIFTLSAVCPLWFSSTIMLFPNSPAWVALTIFPLTAPVTLMLRLGSTAVPAWQIVASMVVLVGCIAGGLVLTAKIVRTYLLMYGKRPSLGEIFRNLRTG